MPNRARSDSRMLQSCKEQRISLSKNVQSVQSLRTSIVYEGGGSRKVMLALCKQKGILPCSKNTKKYHAANVLNSNQISKQNAVNIMQFCSAHVSAQLMRVNKQFLALLRVITYGVRHEKMPLFGFASSV